MVTENTETRTRRYRGLSYRRPIYAAKEAVPILDLAERLSGPGVRRGREIAFRCPLHDDHNPSLRVDPDKGVWFCDPCLLGGDVVELARLAWGYDEREAHTAAARLLMEFGHEVPQRPPAWYRRQQRQQPVRSAIEDALLRRQQRRVFAILWREIGPGLSDDERRAEVKTLWQEALHIAKLLVASRRSA
jgi:CHC2 zinc finger